MLAMPSILSRPTRSLSLDCPDQTALECDIYRPGLPTFVSGPRNPSRFGPWRASGPASTSPAEEVVRPTGAAVLASAPAPPWPAHLRAPSSARISRHQALWWPRRRPSATPGYASISTRGAPAPCPRGRGLTTVVPWRVGGAMNSPRPPHVGQARESSNYLTLVDGVPYTEGDA